MADLTKAPPVFKHAGKNIAFIDIQNIKARIDFNMQSKQAITTTEIEFIQDREGMPLFDLVPEIQSAEMNGKFINILSVSAPKNATQYRIVDKVLPAGMHKLIIKHRMDTNIKFNRRNVELAFWMSDLTDRRYLERYIPCNLEFDQYPLELTLSFDTHEIDRHDIFTNGKLKEIAPNTYQIKFPAYFTASSFYFHMMKKDKFTVKRTHFVSIDNRRIPMTIYSRIGFNVTSAEKQARDVIKELEEILGPWAHPSLTIYVAGMGGMEYSGATMTSLMALGHELIHSYFARGVMPVRGNSGWIDEAIASWRDDGYRTRTSPGFSSTSMGNHSIYQRTTDRKAYDQGADFMEYLDHRLQKQGGLKSFLKETFKHHVHKTITTKNLQNLLESYSGEDFGKDFKQYILGAKTKDQDTAKINPFHRQLSPQEELDLL